MAELKTTRTDASVEAFIDAIADEGRREDCRTLMRVMKQATRAEPAMWGPSIVGFGSYRYKYGSGREAEWFLTGFSPRKANLTLYIMAGFDRYDALMAKLGRHSTGKSCLYVKRLSDIDMSTLKELVSSSVRHLKSKS
jgi:Domain of unknown function (DU1801)